MSSKADKVLLINLSQKSRKHRLTDLVNFVAILAEPPPEGQAGTKGQGPGGRGLVSYISGDNGGVGQREVARPPLFRFFRERHVRVEVGVEKCHRLLHG